jgi:hypothetical protein
MISIILYCCFCVEKPPTALYLQTENNCLNKLKHCIFICIKVKGKSIPVTGHEGPYGCETSRLPQFSRNRLTDGGEIVSPTRRPSFTPMKIPGTHFCYRLIRPQGHSAAGRIRSIEKSNHLIGNRTRDLPACSIVPQPTTLPCAPIIFCIRWNKLVLKAFRFIVF